MKQSNGNTVAHENLRTFCVLRLIPLLGMCYGAWYLVRRDVENLHWQFIFILLAGFILVISLAWLRSFLARSVSHGEFFSHLVVDIGIYSLLMFNTGGAANPFTSYLLVPVAIAAIALPSLLTVLVGGICLGSYTLLLFWHIPLPLVTPGDGGHSESGSTMPDLHTVGMWLNFMVSALLIGYFVNRMSKRIAAQDKTLRRQQQRRLEDEQLLAVATLAASAAHELGTPLNTMKLITDEWKQDDFDSGPAGFGDDLAIVEQQIDRCRHTLQKLSGAAREFSSANTRTQSARDYFADLLDNWLIMRPDIRANARFDESDPTLEIRYHPALSASILNLLNNAGDASPEKVDIHVTWDANRATLAIRDYGEGLEGNITGRRPVDSEKPGGLGLGLFLARTILSRHQASVSLESQTTGGTLTTVTLPMNPANG